MLSPSCLFNGYMGSCDKNFLSKTTSSPHFLTYVISSRVASDYLVYSLILLHLLLTLKKIRQYSKVGNALQKGINHQNYNDSVFVSRTSERALLLVQMQCIFFFLHRNLQNDWFLPNTMPQRALCVSGENRN